MVDLQRELAARNFRRWHEAKATWESRLILVLVMVAMVTGAACFVVAALIAVEGSFRMWFNWALVAVDTIALLAVAGRLYWAWSIQRHEQPKL